MNTNGKKRGRPRALTPEKQKEVLAFSEAGGSRTKAAQYVGVSVTTVADEAQRNQAFLDSLTRAEAHCYQEEMDWG